jgi:hypothetical protein
MQRLSWREGSQVSNELSGHTFNFQHDDESKGNLNRPLLEEALLLGCIFHPARTG